MDMVQQEIPAIATAVPKTMRELAEDAERQRNESGSSTPIQQISVSAPIATPMPEVIGSGKGRKTRRGSGTSGSAQRPATRSTRTRKRARLEDSDSEDRATGDHVQIVTGPTPAKRARPASAPVAKSDRVLRARKGKSGDTLREEQEMEAAFKRAIAQ